ncbi:MAG: hypothetical protein Q8R09_01380, partial [Anaerolineaceae bacterium]|nr:hypothetical protein [Anaerolineaceae bacterium]
LLEQIIFIVIMLECFLCLSVGSPLSQKSLALKERGSRGAHISRTRTHALLVYVLNGGFSDRTHPCILYVKS